MCSVVACVVVAVDNGRRCARRRRPITASNDPNTCARSCSSFLILFSLFFSFKKKPFGEHFLGTCGHAKEQQGKRKKKKCILLVYNNNNNDNNKKI